MTKEERYKTCTTIYELTTQEADRKGSTTDKDKSGQGSKRAQKGTTKRKVCEYHEKAVFFIEVFVPRMDWRKLWQWHCVCQMKD